MSKKIKSLIPTAIMPQSNLFNRFFSEFDSLFDHIGPRVDIKEDEATVIIKAELPGLTREDIVVELDDNILTISGEKKNERSEIDIKYYRTEIGYGKFTRSFRIPEYVDNEHIQAKCKDGILEISIPKLTISEKKSSKQISID